LPEEEKSFSPIFNFGSEAESTACGRATPGGSAVPAKVDGRSESASGSQPVSKDLHMRLKKQILYFAIDADSDNDPEPRFAGQDKAMP
jgi:hypothetical protein